jgi:hypothetical protein
MVLRKVERSFRVLGDLDGGALGALLHSKPGLGVLLAAEVLTEEAAGGAVEFPALVAGLDGVPRLAPDPLFFQYLLLSRARPLAFALRCLRAVRGGCGASRSPFRRGLNDDRVACGGGLGGSNTRGRRGSPTGWDDDGRSGGRGLTRGVGSFQRRTPRRQRRQRVGPQWPSWRPRTRMAEGGRQRAAWRSQGLRFRILALGAGSEHVLANRKAWNRLSLTRN